MRSFEQERVKHTSVNSTKFKHPIPLVYVEPKQTTQDSCVLIYCSGLWSTNASCLYLNNDFYDNHWFVSYEKMAHGENKNEPSQYRKPYIDEIYAVVQWTKATFPDKKIYLLGESFGGAIALIFLKKYPQLVNGVVAWNAPFRPKDSEKNTAKVKAECAVKEIWTLLTNRTCSLPVVQKTHDKISRDALFVRVMSMRPMTRQNSKTTIAVWRYMHSSKHFLKRNGKNNNFNYLYIQSGQDALCDFKMFKRIMKKSDSRHIYYMPTGYHLLSLEPVEANCLYKKINDFISRK